MRQYQKRTALQPNHWRLQKRLVITRHSLRHASVIYRSGNYCLPANQSQAERDPQLERQFFIMEQSQLHTIYEKMLYLDVPLPRAGQVNSHVLDFVDQFASDFELIGTTAHDLRGFVEVLDRASQRTFNSPLITRHLFHALVRLGEFEEAEHALHSYLYLVGLVSHGWKETRYDGPAVVSSKTGSSRPVPNPRPDVVDQEDSHEKKPGGVRESIMSDVSDIKMAEKESSKHTLQVLLAAIKMYCQDLGRSVEAVEMAEIAKEFYQKQHKQERMTVLLDIGPCVYRAIGIAYGLLGSQTLDPELRPTYHETSLNYLKQALELNSHAWQSFYQLALQQAEMRDIGQAIQSVTQAIQRNPNHVPSWHLLTLLISCPVQDDYKQALKTCDMGLQQAHMEDQEGEGDINQFDEAEQHMMYHITRILLMHTMHGPESALESSETLFSLFRKVAMPEPSMSTASSENLAYAGAHHGMIVSGSFGNLSELNLAAEQRKRGRSTSNSTTMSQLPHSAVELGSRSHDIMLNPTTETKKTGRARSASNLSMQPSPLGPSHSQLLSVPDTSATTQQQQHHHHLPHGLHLFRSRSSSIRKSQQPENLVPSSSATTNAPKSNVSMQSLPTSPYDMKNAAGNSVASLQSIAPSIMSTNSILQPSTIPTKPSTRMVLRKERSDRILSDLWLLTARMFIQLGKLDEAHKALEEAENVDWTSNPQVWCVLGQLLQAEGDPEQAQAAFYKSLAIDPHDVTCRLELAKSHLSQDNQEIAEGILDVMTKSNGWNCAEAWFHLGEIYKNTDRIDRTKACLFYALELESTTPIQPFSVLSRFA
ncbi:uncharacterized protein B0P05DRAFT_464519 [Gilbertella persicaria]|uniref:uncharacterized protein n=1 Tax=Gilbertella persicaria TaxID=101096 RepID=UPI002220AE12|nr:uncharacterized protein B0P05DRAFT_464519 [Gilbertella persicaria]KAI8090162.1 hypothetical protein B0P05DRAFT_464519 [Gilbertella persicaria]